jgi:hypothetical protein
MDRQFDRQSAVALWLMVVVSLLLGCQPSFQPLPLARGDAGVADPDLPPSNYELAEAGTVFVWRDLNTGEIVEEHVLDHMGRLLRANYGSRYSFAYAPHPWADNENTSEADVEPIFPLVVGKKATFERWPSAGRTTDSIEVLRTETLALPIGTVDTYVIESRSQALSGGWAGKTTVWYAPALRWQVQWEITDNQGDNRRRQVIEVREP